MTKMTNKGGKVRERKQKKLDLTARTVSEVKIHTLCLKRSVSEGSRDRLALLRTEPLT